VAAVTVVTVLTAAGGASGRPHGQPPARSSQVDPVAQLLTGTGAQAIATRRLSPAARDLLKALQRTLATSLHFQAELPGGGTASGELNLSGRASRVVTGWPGGAQFSWLRVGPAAYVSLRELPAVVRRHLPAGAQWVRLPTAPFGGPPARCLAPRAGGLEPAQPLPAVACPMVPQPAPAGRPSAAPLARAAQPSPVLSSYWWLPAYGWLPGWPRFPWLGGWPLPEGLVGGLLAAGKVSATPHGFVVRLAGGWPVWGLPPWPHPMLGLSGAPRPTGHGVSSRPGKVGGSPGVQASAGTTGPGVIAQPATAVLTVRFELDRAGRVQRITAGFGGSLLWKPLGWAVSLSRFGEPVRVSPPPAARVVTTTELIRAEMRAFPMVGPCPPGAPLEPAREYACPLRPIHPLAPSGGSTGAATG
jgi:hypothetical protein